MMARLLLFSVLLIVCHTALLEEVSIKEKRQGYCPPGGCSSSSCLGGNCGQTNNCIGGNCGHINTLQIICSQCMNKCSSTCSDGQCLSGCLGSCSCNNCCYVMHPKQCYTEETGSKRCFMRRHRECSDLCSSSVVTIQPQPSLPNTGCHYMQNYPYVYCGKYERQNCGQCYICNGGFNPGQCSRQSTCSDTCRQTMPSCVQTQAGIQCF